MSLASFVRKKKPSVTCSLTVVAKCMWKHISQAIGIGLGESFETIGSKWLINKKKKFAINVISSAALLGIWKLKK